MRFSSACLHLLILLPLTLTGCGGGANPFRAVERAVEGEMARRIGPAERYRAQVSRSGANLVAGRIPWIEIEGKNVRMAEGLILSELRVRLEEVRFDRGSRTMTGMERGEFTASFAAEALTAAVRRRGPRLRDVRVRLRGEDVVVDATPALLGVGVPVQVEGRPALRDETRIDFAVSRLAVLRIGLPGFAIRELEETINPIVDLGALRMPVRADEVRVDGGRLRVSGRVTVEPRT